MRGILVLAALLGLGAGVIACLCNPGTVMLHPAYVVRGHTGFVPAALELEIHVQEDEVVLVHESESGTLRVHYTKVLQIGP